MNSDKNIGKCSDVLSEEKDDDEDVLSEEEDDEDVIPENLYGEEMNEYVRVRNEEYERVSGKTINWVQYNHPKFDDNDLKEFLIKNDLI